MSILNPDGSINDSYRNYIALSRYSRYLDAYGRRETWTETVDRYMNFMTEHLYEKYDYVPPESLVSEIRTAITEHEVMPSMRALMTAGPALARENLAAYNCAYLPIQDIRSLSEVLYILMCGTGVGFSVESKYVSELPALPEAFEWFPDSAVTIAVGDSKEGWASAFALLLEEVWERGRVPYVDLSAVRPAGSRLHTFGGRASGPEPLHDLLTYTVQLLTSAAGRQLRPIEVHDLVCKIASVVVVGGVRRSAMISLSDLNDQEMAAAKTGPWYETHPHRALSNNSAVYEGETSRTAFNREWATIQGSGSGERGIFNRNAAQAQASGWGRRDAGVSYGVNPCGEIIMRPYGLCNLTEVVVREDDTSFSLYRKAYLAAILGTWQSTLTDFHFVRDHWRTNAEEERLLGVSLTGTFGNEILTLGDSWTEIVLKAARATARQANWNEARQLGIPESAAVTTIKPSGTVSQLTGVSSGEHPWHSPFFIRTVRADEKDPLAALLIDAGVPHERDVMQPTNWVFSFPRAAPGGAVTRADLTAIAHLEHWLLVKRSWCEHNVSVTISVREHEWDEVREWVWEHLDELTGVSFLPYSEHTYRQAPYQEISAEEYAAAVRDFPVIRWADLTFYENGDQTTGVQELACTASGCDVI